MLLASRSMESPENLDPTSSDGTCLIHMQLQLRPSIDELVSLRNWPKLSQFREYNSTSLLALRRNNQAIEQTLNPP